MKKWILFLLNNNAKLDRLVEKTENKIERISLDLITPIHKIYQKVFELNDLKIKLINMRVMCNSILSCLDQKELTLVKNKKINSEIVKKCEKILALLGYNEEMFLNEYISSKDLRSLTSPLL